MGLKLQATQLSERLKVISARVPYTSKDINTAIILCRNQLTNFQSRILNEDFDSITSEIEFFKEIKQIPMNNLIYFSEIRSLELHYPRANKERQEGYLRRRMDKINSFYIHNLDFIEYINTGKTHLDEQYFTRRHLDEHIITHTKFYYLHPDFNTSHDLQLAKLKAYQRLINYLYSKLNLLENPLELALHKKRSLHELQWTATKIALTELVYALYHSGSINNGNVDIKEIAEALSQLFNIDLGDYYRTYSEIRLRKKSRAKFLEKLTYSLSTKMDSEDK
ncbi:RteC domain-containing protein [Maribacter sp. D37]|nr:RteC domain-containing protein [Maribacter polysaccharolyticus]MDE3744093.1 RteC domain-containing protein [Maribacter polysaccharolyticus]